jgi:hypothetical protein
LLLRESASDGVQAHESREKPRFWGRKGVE